MACCSDCFKFDANRIMSDTTYHVKIKREYASAILENLLQADAIEIIEDVVPVWQQEETLKRLQQMKENSVEAVSHEDFLKTIAE